MLNEQGEQQIFGEETLLLSKRETHSIFATSPLVDLRTEVHEIIRPDARAYPFAELCVLMLDKLDRDIAKYFDVEVSYLNDWVMCACT